MQIVFTEAQHILNSCYQDVVHLKYVEEEAYSSFQRII